MNVKMVFTPVATLVADGILLSYLSYDAAVIQWIS